MQNEFYMVEFDWGEQHYFKDKDKAFAFLWQSYLNDSAYNNDEEMEADRNSLNENYYIDGYGSVNVRGFED